MFERFTARARRVLVLAQEEARLLNHGFIGTEHILLGLLHEGEGVGGQVLSSMNLSLAAVRDKVEATIGRGTSVPVDSPPFTPRAKKALELALRESIQLGHSYIGTEHLLLGLVREGEGVAAQLLVSMGADLMRVRQQVIRQLAGAGGAQRPVDTLPTSGHDRERSPSRPGVRGVPPMGPRCALCGRDLWEAQHFVAAGRTAVCDDCVRASAQILDAAAPEERRLLLPPRVFGAVPDDQAVTAITASVQAAFSVTTTPADRATAVEHFDEVEDAFGRHEGRLAAEPDGTWLHRIRFAQPDLAEVMFELTRADGTTASFQGRVHRDGGGWKVTRQLVATVLGPG